jgi:hypothetical protein
MMEAKCILSLRSSWRSVKATILEIVQGRSDSSKDLPDHKEFRLEAGLLDSPGSAADKNTQQPS